MMRRIGQPVRTGLFLLVVLTFVVLTPFAGWAAPYAAMVMDARTGEVLHAENAETQLHPASLTKMMTLYIAFEAVERGEITLDTLVTIPRAAAAEPPSKLGLTTGQQIRFRYLIRAAAVKSANDAATAIAFAVSGSEEAFARRMNRTAEAMGMTRTHFKNAHGLTEAGHMSTAHDMTILGRHIIYDWPQYYNLFSRLTTDAGITTVSHTNRQFLSSYSGADGIKTGYTSAAGYNLVASAERGQERIITTVFGGTSTAARNAKVAELMDLGFRKAPDRVALRLPERPPYSGNGQNTEGAYARAARASGLLTRSLRPHPRPAMLLPEIDGTLVASVVAEAVEIAAPETVASAVEGALAFAAPDPAEGTETATAPIRMAVAPPMRPEELVVPEDAAASMPEMQVVTSLSTSSAQHWGINVGRYGSRNEAERALLRVALNEMSTLEGSLRRVLQSSSGFDATFMGLTRETADLACRRLQARGTTCFMIGSAG